MGKKNKFALADTLSTVAAVVLVSEKSELCIVVSAKAGAGATFLKNLFLSGRLLKLNLFWTLRHVVSCWRVLLRTNSPWFGSTGGEADFFDKKKGCDPFLNGDARTISHTAQSASTRAPCRRIDSAGRLDLQEQQVNRQASGVSK